MNRVGTWKELLVGGVALLLIGAVAGIPVLVWLGAIALAAVLAGWWVNALVKYHRAKGGDSAGR
jgi:type III secretory pathway component EscV